jgi:hypothetical protein
MLTYRITSPGGPTVHAPGGIDKIRIHDGPLVIETLEALQIKENNTRHTLVLHVTDRIFKFGLAVSIHVIGFLPPSEVPHTTEVLTTFEFVSVGLGFVKI